MRFEDVYGEQLERIRTHSAEAGKFSWTTLKYQSDLLNFIYANRSQGACLVEVGCFRGGLTALLAFAAKELDLVLDVIDIEPPFIQSATDLVTDLGLADRVRYFRGTFPQFVEQRGSSEKPLLVVLDGDHAYPGVMADIEAAMQLRPRPFALAFHDFSLRHPTSDERVSEAIADYFGAEARPALIGQPMMGEGHWTREKPSDDGHYWEVPGSEGAILKLEGLGPAA